MWIIISENHFLNAESVQEIIFERITSTEVKLNIFYRNSEIMDEHVFELFPNVTPEQVQEVLRHGFIKEQSIDLTDLMELV